MDKKIKRVLDFLFPLTYTCNVCGREIFENKYFCEDCEKDLPKNDGIICNHCGRHTYNGEEYCFSCGGRETYFERARSAFIYKKPINALIAGLKYSGRRYLATVFAPRLANLYYAALWACDMIVYVPMTEERLKERGYNQAKLIADALSEIIGVPVADGVVVKTKETPRQASLESAKQRRENLKGSFKVLQKKLIDGKRILLVDDVMTTGATVEAVSEVLASAGARGVFVLTVASVSKEQNVE